jgi:menaquinol-cytochrome c reductase iron-sulfur subunit
MPDTVDHDAVIGRRHFLTRLSLGLTAFAGAVVGVPVVGFVLGPLFRKTPPVWREVGALETFKVGQTVEVTYETSASLSWAGITSQSAAWLRRTDPQTVEAFSIHCTHLGCPTRWEATPQLFMCPCHGGVFYANGEVAAGPPPRPLVRVGARIRDGHVEIETSEVPITRGTLSGE